MGLEQRLIHFSGAVQGVGFRYTAARVAREHRVCGYVRNLRDGHVEVLVEGEAAEIDAFVAAVQERMSGYIRDMDQQTAEPTGRFSSFDIRL